MAAESSPDSTNNVNPLTPVHNPSLNKFVLACGGGEEAFLSYNIEDNGMWDAYHTEVPISQRGKGLGGVLAEALFNHARDSGIKLKLTCTYLQHYLSKHPEWDNVISFAS